MVQQQIIETSAPGLPTISVSCSGRSYFSSDVQSAVVCLLLPWLRVSYWLPGWLMS